MALSFDRRRINGPEDSVPAVFSDDDDESAYAHWSSGSSRVGRNAEDIRPIFLNPGLISQANGSAYIETERTKLVCAVYGPRQTKGTTYNESGKLNVEVKFAPFSCHRRRAPIRDAEDRSVAIQIQQALIPSLRLELLPKSTVDVYVTILENDGIESCIAAASIATSAALADSGIEMLGLVVSCTASIVEKEVWLDPTEQEIRVGRGSLTLACMPALGTVTSVSQTGQMTAEEVIECMEKCQERCTDVHSVVAQALLDHPRTL